MRFLICWSLVWIACSADSTSHPDTVSPPVDATTRDLAPDLGPADAKADRQEDQDLAPVGELADRLAAIEGFATVVELEATAPLRVFEIEIRQPMRHAQPQSATFLQRLRLIHRDVAAPMVLYSTGYMMSPAPKFVDVAEVLSANQLTVEPRFNGKSRPAKVDWSTLTIAEAAADFHAIITKLRPIYGARWLSVGGSKGGMDTIYHRHFYPSDVAATVAYVAPNSHGLADDRYPAFLAKVGTAQCREALTAIARKFLLRDTAMIDRMKALEASNNISFAHLGYRKALEHATLEFLFAYWQYRGTAGCASIPDASTVTDDNLFKYVDGIVSIPFFADSGIAPNEPYFYQAATELGFPAPYEEPVADLLQSPGSYRAAAYLLDGQSVTFDPTAMDDIQSWISSEGERLLFVYGALDPYSAAAFDIAGAKDSYLYVVEGGTHYVRLDALAPTDKAEALTSIQRWAK